MVLSAEDGRPGASASLGSSNNNNNNILTIPYVPGKPSEERGLGCLVLEKIADVVGRNNPFGDQDDGELDLDDSRVQLLDFDFARQKNPTDSDKRLLDKTQEIEANLLLPRECDVSKIKRKIKSKGIIQFVIMRRPAIREKDEEWQIFDRKTLESLINHIKNNNAKMGNGLSMWGKVLVVGHRIDECLPTPNRTIQKSRL